MEAMSRRKFNRCIKELNRLKDIESGAEYRVTFWATQMEKYKSARKQAHTDVREMEKRVRGILIQNKDGSVSYANL